MKKYLIRLASAALTIPPAAMRRSTSACTSALEDARSSGPKAQIGHSVRFQSGSPSSFLTNRIVSDRRPLKLRDKCLSEEFLNHMNHL
jgi:hypothetical protein